MLDKNFWQGTLEKQTEFDNSRRKIISESSNALQLSKQTIFSLQRGNKKEAQASLAEAKEYLINLEKRFGHDGKLRCEGSWKAGIEEFIEAKLFMDFYLGQEITGLNDFPVLPDEFIGGLSDLTGEIVRMMILWTTKGEIDKVKSSAEVIAEVIEELMTINYGGYLRTKFDQAKKNQQKAEQIIYDLAIRDK